MAKISKKRLNYGGKRQDFEMHYHSEKGFFIKLPKEVESIARQEYQLNEEQAEKHANERIEKYEKACLTQRKMLAIYQSEAPNTFIGGIRVDVSQISFAYTIVFENTLPDGTKAVVDGSGRRAYHRGVLIEWTEEREKKCLDLCERLDEAAQKLHDFLQEAQETPELLDVGPLLLQ